MSSVNGYTPPQPLLDMNNSEPEASPYNEQEELLLLYKGEKQSKGEPTEDVKKDVTDEKPQRVYVSPCELNQRKLHGSSSEVLQDGSTNARDPWRTGLFECVNVKGDEWTTNDYEMCALAFCAPCVLSASNRSNLHRAISSPPPCQGADAVIKDPLALSSSSSSVPLCATGDDFQTHCLHYLALYFLGQCFCHANCCAPIYSHTTRVAVRKAFGLQSDGHAIIPQQNEPLNHLLDFFLHFFCHPCALAQEGREIRRRCGPPPPFPTKMVTPAEQEMRP